MKNIILLMGLACAIAMFIISCTTGPQKKTLREGASHLPPEKNQLVINHTSFTLPEGWLFRQPEPTENGNTESILFHFHNPEKTLWGTFEYAPVSPELTLDDCISYYEDEVLEDFKAVRSVDTRIDGREAVILSAKKDEMGNARNGGDGNNGDGGLLLAIFQEEQQVNAIEIVGSQEEITARARELSGILHSYQFVEEEYSKRLRGEGPSFHSFTSDWRWFDDFPGGLYLRGTIADVPAVVGVSTAGAEAMGAAVVDMYSENASQASFETTDSSGEAPSGSSNSQGSSETPVGEQPQTFPASFFIGNRKVVAQGLLGSGPEAHNTANNTSVPGDTSVPEDTDDTVTEDTDDEIRLYYTLDYPGEELFVYIGLGQVPEDFDAATFHQREEVRKLIGRHLLLSGLQGWAK